jgi:hypothetical protein
MGSWSETIMGGDTPLDYLAVLGEAVGAVFDYDDESTPEFHGWHITREMLEVDDIQAKLRDAHASVGNDYIFGQVVGAVFLWAGARMSDEIKLGVKVCAEHELNQIEKTGWTDPERRAGFLRDLIEKVEEHKTGERVELADEGLFENMAKMFG